MTNLVTWMKQNGYATDAYQAFQMMIDAGITPTMSRDEQESRIKELCNGRNTSPKIQAVDKSNAADNSR